MALKQAATASSRVEPPPPPATTSWLGGFILGLPRLTGPHQVGVADVEVPWDYNDRTTAGLPVAASVLVRLYYPTSETAGKPALWLPSYKYAIGYCDFMKIPRVFGYSIMAPFFSQVTMPHTKVDAQLASSNHSFPILLFSHGLGAMRTTYSNICSEIASHGFIVAAVEHGDHSASLSLRNNSTTESTFVRYLPALGDEFQFRHEQVLHRVDEVYNTIDLLHRINNGDTITNLIQSSKVDLKMFAGKFDFERISIAGHSFGGATAVGASADPRNLFKAVLCLDGWMFPLGPAILQQERKTPVLFLNSESFQWESNLEQMRQWVRQGLLIKHDKPSAVLGYIQGTGHQNQSDFALLLPAVMRTLKMIGPKQQELAAHLNNRACLSFISWHAPRQDNAAEPNWFENDPLIDTTQPNRPADGIVLENL